MRVVELWRFPVKSLQGERIEEAELGAEGIEGDRRYAIFDVDIGYGLTARRAPEMLFASARTTPRRDGGDPAARVTSPDLRLWWGSGCEGAACLKVRCGR
jgi:uncharacterized protein YcbX